MVICAKYIHTLFIIFNFFDVRSFTVLVVIIKSERLRLKYLQAVLTKILTIRTGNLL